MYVAITHEFTAAPMQLTVTLSYYQAAEGGNPVHEDTLVFSLSELVGSPPSVQLDRPERLRDQLYNRIQDIEKELTRLLTLNALLDNLPAEQRLSQAETLRMLEGVLDGDV